MRNSLDYEPVGPSLRTSMRHDIESFPLLIEPYFPLLSKVMLVCKSHLLIVQTFFKADDMFVQFYRESFIWKKN